MQNPEQDFDQSGFAGTVWAQQSEDFPAIYREGNMTERVMNLSEDQTLTIRFGQVSDVDGLGR